jgi:Fe-Mn family superoxide dismutase
MAFSLPSLPFEYTALEPHIDALTMNIHHTKHHQTYVNNLNAALDKFPEFRDLGLVSINQAVGSDKVPAEVATAVRNNGGGHWNHRCVRTAGPLHPAGPGPGPRARTGGPSTAHAQRGPAI